MTAAKSTAKKSYFMTNFLNRVRENKKTSVILTILHLLSAPLVLINLIIYQITYQKYELAKALAEKAAGKFGNVDYSKLPQYIDFNEAYLVIAVIATGLAVLAGIVIAMQNYSYLYKKTQVDMIYSLPMTTTERFFSDFIAGIASYIVPFLASSVVTFILCCIAKLTCNDWINTDFIVNATEGFGFQTIGQIVFQGSLYGIFVMIMTYTISVLVITCCGNFLESGAYIFVTNALIPSAIAVAGFIFLGDLYGMDITSSVIPVIEVTSPFGAIVKMIMVVDEYDTEMTIWNIMLTRLLPFAIFTAIYFGLAFVLYKKRKAEDVSKPFVYRIFYYIVSTAITFCIATLFIGENGFDAGPMPMVITSAIVFFIMEVIANRGFKKLWKSILRFGITIIVMIFSIYIVQKTEGFGMVYYVPSASSVRSVEIDYRGINSTNSVDEYCILRDKNNIQAVIDAQTENLEAHRLDANAYNNYDYINIIYTMNSGRKISRSYNLSYDQYKKLSAIDTSEEYIDCIINKLRSEVVSHAGNTDPDFYVYIYDKVGNRQNVSITTLNSTQAQLNELIDALDIDMHNISAEDYFSPTAECYGYVNIFSVTTIPLSDNYPNVMAVLARNGYTARNDISYISEISLGKYNINENGDDNFGEYVNITSAAQYYPEEIEKLFKYSQYVHLKDAEYYININDDIYYIPAELTSTAAELFEYAWNNVSFEGYIVNQNYETFYFSSYNEAEEIVKYIYETGGYVNDWNEYDGNGRYIDKLVSHYQSEYK